MIPATHLSAETAAALLAESRRRRTERHAARDHAERMTNFEVEFAALGFSASAAGELAAIHIELERQRS